MRKNITIRSKKQTEKVGDKERRELQSSIDSGTAEFLASGGKVKVSKSIDSSAFKVASPARAVARGF